MNVKSYPFPIPRTSIDSATFTGAYQAINPLGLSAPCFSLKIVNNSGADIDVSWDGINDHDFFPTMSQDILDIQTNSQPSNEVNLARRGQVIYVKGSASTGSIYLIGWMQPSSNPAGL